MGCRGWASESGGATDAAEEVTPDIPNKDGVTPLSLAAACGPDGAAKLILGRNDVDLGYLDNGGQTPLSLAAENGQREWWGY